jgi:acylglycerol lipase
MAGSERHSSLLWRAARRNIGVVSTDRASVVAAIVAAVAADPAGDHSVSALAQRAHVSHRHLHRLFARNLQCPPARFVELVRVTAARRLLTESDEPMAAIGLQVGFASTGDDAPSVPPRSRRPTEHLPRARPGRGRPRRHGRIRGVPVVAGTASRSHHRRMLTLSGVSRWIQSDDGVVLHERWWPIIDARVVMVFVHGIASHGGWFTETAEQLAADDVAVVAPDRRGSGLSHGPQGHVPSFERAIADVDAAVIRAQHAYPDVPVVLGASSWAAKLAVVYGASAPARLAGLALIGPGLFPTVGLPWARRAQVVVGHHVAPRARIPIPLTPEQYTTNPRYLQFIHDDPLRLRTASAQFFWETARLDRRRRAASTRLRLPVVVLQGSADAMMSAGHTRRWFDRLDAPDKTYRAYPGAGHTLDFEADRGAYLDDLRSWLWQR